MTLDDLRTVGALIRRGSMSGAAAELHTVQSNVTGRIRALEDELNAELFIRSTRGVRPTAAGSRLNTFGERILLLVEEACATFQGGQVPEGALHIGAIEVTVSIRIPDLIADFLRLYPQVQLTVAAGTSDQLVCQVLQRDLDGCFAIGAQANSNLEVFPLYTDELALISSAEFTDLELLTGTEPVLAIVFREGCSYRQRLTRFLDEQGIQYKILAISSLEALKTSLLRMKSVTLLPKAILATTWRGEAMAAHSLPEGQRFVETSFVSGHWSQHNVTLQTFLKLTREFFAHASLPDGATACPEETPAERFR